MPKKKYYAVAIGRQLGVFEAWNECEAQVKGVQGAKFKSFDSKSEAELFVETNKTGTTTTKRSQPQAQPKTPDPKRKKIEPTRKVKMVIRFDGGSRGNPGLSGAGSEILVMEQTMSGSILKQQRIQIRKFLKRATNNEAEYHALLSAIEEAKKIIAEIPKADHTWVADIQVMGDSNLIIQQQNGTNQCRSTNLIPIYQQVKLTLSQIRAIIPLEVTFEHVYRKDNTVADGECIFKELVVHFSLVHITHVFHSTCKRSHGYKEELYVCRCRAY